MNKAIRVLGCLAVLALAFGGVASLAGHHEKDVELNGSFKWVRSDGETEGDLKAILTPTGEGTWDVAFHFDWDDGPHVYEGTAKGSLTGGLEGEVQTDNKERPGTFKFMGEFADGTFSGKHGSVRDDGFSEMGTLTLSK